MANYVSNRQRQAHWPRPSLLVAIAGAALLLPAGPLAMMPTAMNEVAAQSARDRAMGKTRNADAAKNTPAPAPQRAAPAPAPQRAAPAPPAAAPVGPRPSAAPPAPGPSMSPAEARQRAMGQTPRQAPAPSRNVILPGPVQQRPVAPPPQSQPRMRVQQQAPSAVAPPVMGPRPPSMSPSDARNRALGRDRSTTILPQPRATMPAVPPRQDRTIHDRRLPQPPAAQPRPVPHDVTRRSGRDGALPRRDAGEWRGDRGSGSGQWQRGGQHFDRPLRGSEPSHWRGHDRSRYHHPAPASRSRLSISIGAHFGHFYSPPPVYITNPFTYYSAVYCAPRYRPVYWSSYYHPYYSSYGYPFYSHTYYSYPRHSFGISFGSGSFRSHSSWLFHYRFGHVPVYPVAHTTLVRPAVVHVVQPATTIYVPTTVADSGWFGSTAVANDPVGVVLPEPQRTEYPVVQPEPARVTTGADLGMTYLQLGDGESALRVLIHHLTDYPNDTEAIRAIALAYLLLGEGENGIRQIGRAYRLSPWLTSRPLPRDLLSQQDHAYVLDVATHTASQQRSPEAWLAVAILMQGQENHSAARAAMERAQAAGLDQQIVDRFMITLPPERN